MVLPDLAQPYNENENNELKEPLHTTSSRLQEKNARKTVPGGSHWNFDASTAVTTRHACRIPAQALHELVLFLERRRVAETKIAEAEMTTPKIVESVAMDQSCSKLAMLCSIDL